LNSVTLNSHAKVNLFLDILGVLDNGYHTLNMINAKIALHDDVECSLVDEPGIHLKMSDPGIPTDKSNTAYKAALLLQESLSQAGHICPGIKINIEKRIPHGAGLGGGSSNAASVLTGLNQLCGNLLSNEKLMKIGVLIGADVPFFLMDGFAHIGGIGEEIDPVPTPKTDTTPLWMVLCSPKIHVSTKEAYALWDESADKKHGDSLLLRRALEAGKWAKIPGYLFNSFEAVIYPAYPKLYLTYQDFYTHSPTRPLLSGSGSNMFSLHTSKDIAEEVCENMVRAGNKAAVTSMLI